jgi:catechol 2,3-dioxygenase-like lactoylglutathione lyase family enzyme
MATERAAPVLAVRVGDLSAWVRFLTDQVGFELAEHRADEDVALIRTERSVLLYAGPGAGDVASYFGGTAPAPFEPWMVRFNVADVAARAAELERRGGTVGLRWETAWGDRAVTARAPEGTTVDFVESGPERSPAESIRFYARGPDEVEAAVAGLDDGALDATPRPTQWSIRQIVHHLVDGDQLWTWPLKVALATPGQELDMRYYRSNDVWAESLVYAGRPIGPALALFRASRTVVLELLERVPDALERDVQVRQWTDEPVRTSVGEIVRIQARHALTHAAEIGVIGRLSGR